MIDWKITAHVRGFACWIAILAIAMPARAHTRTPYVERIVLDPSDPDRLLAQFSFGLAQSEDAGASWRWVCASAYGADANWEDPDVVVTSDGSIVLGTFAGALRSQRDLCSFDVLAGSIADTFVLDLARGADDVIFAATSRGGGEPDRVQRSDDGGRTWSIAGEPVSALLATVVIAPSDLSRVYASAAIPATDIAPRRAIVLRSDDGGGHFEPIELDVEVGELEPRIAGVDPDDADRVFLRMTRDDLALEPERLRVSEDGARTFRTLIERPQLRAFAITSDTVWVGSAAGGLLRADASTLAFEELGTIAVRCLVPREGELFLCADEQREGFSIGRSIDGGTHVEPVFVLASVRALPSCPACTSTAATCPAWIDDLQSDFARYFDAGGGWPSIDASVSACSDAGMEPDAGRSSDAGSFDGGTRIAARGGGCGCSAPHDGAPSLGVVAIAVLFVLARRRR